MRQDRASGRSLARSCQLGRRCNIHDINFLSSASCVAIYCTLSIDWFGGALKPDVLYCVALYLNG